MATQRDRDGTAHTQFMSCATAQKDMAFAELGCFGPSEHNLHLHTNRGGGVLADDVDRS